jgi:hypothetical protein
LFLKENIHLFFTHQNLSGELGVDQGLKDNSKTVLEALKTLAGRKNLLRTMRSRLG